MTDNKNLVPKDDEIKSTHIQHQENHNCQQFFGPISGCVFAMPGANVTMSNGELSNTNKEKAHCKECCFKYDNEEYFNIAIQEFTNKLKEGKLISEDTDYHKMMALFRGEKCRTKINWTGPKTLLAHLVDKLCASEDPVITTWPEGTSRWVVVKNRFYKGGKSVGDIHSCSTNEQTPSSKELIGMLYDSLANYIR